MNVWTKLQKEIETTRQQPSRLADLIKSTEPQHHEAILDTIKANLGGDVCEKINRIIEVNR